MSKRDENQREKSRIKKLLKKADELMDLEKFQYAMDYYDEAIIINANNVRAHVGKAFALNYLGRFEEALPCIDKVIELDPDSAGEIMNKGIILADWYDAQKDEKKLHSAIHYYDKAITLEPDFAIAFYNKGLALILFNKPEQAIECFDQAINLYPDMAVAFDSKGSALNSIGKHDDAIKCYDHAIKLQPNFSEALHNKANSLYYLDRVEEAAYFLDKAVEINPNIPDHDNIRGMLKDRLDFNRSIHKT